MKILFVYTNINGQHADSFADGISMIMAVTKQAGHEIKQVQIFEKSEYNTFKDEVRSYKPDVIGFTAVSSQYSFVSELCDLAKDIYPNVVTVCGGIHPTLYPECVTEAKNLDVIFRGDSEVPFIDFLQKIKKNKSWKDNESIAFLREDGTVKKNKLAQLPSPEDLDKMPFPDRETFSYDKILQKVGIASFHFTRGCPFVCTYCSNIGIAKVYGQSRYNIRQASPEHSISEIEDVVLKNPDVGKKYIIYLTDDIFGLNKKWRREFLALYRERIKIPFVCLLRCDVVNEDFMKDLARSYCMKIQFGVESGDDHVRNEIMKRSMERSTIVDAFKLAKKYNVKTNAINIIGVPGETKEMLMNTIKLNREINPTTSNVNIFYPYKGTPLGDQAFKDGIVNIEAYKDFSNERRASVMDYSEEWLDTLKYFKENWTKEVYPFYNIKHYPSILKDTKKIVGSIPILGSALKKQFYRRKQLTAGNL
jgi:anaerobic magnesium-protoporphyrin IX monomethyl ester cyclase